MEIRKGDYKLLRGNKWNANSLKHICPSKILEVIKRGRSIIFVKRKVYERNAQNNHVTRIL
jgi:hypothetical protein